MSKMLAIVFSMVFGLTAVSFAQAPSADQKPADQKMEQPAPKTKKQKKAHKKAVKKASKSHKKAMKKDEKAAEPAPAAPAPAENPTK